MKNSHSNIMEKNDSDFKGKLDNKDDFKFKFFKNDKFEKGSQTILG